MRVISDLEKNIIDRVCDGRTHISVLFTDNIPDFLLKIDKDQNTAELVLKNSSDQNNIVEIAVQQTEKIIYIIKFLQYLEHEGYILSGHFAHGRVVNPVLGSSDNYNKYQDNKSGYTNWMFTDEKIKRIIFNASDLTILPIHQLITFKKGGYKTQEDVRHNNMIVISSIALFVSLALGAISICQNINNDEPSKKQMNYLLLKIEKIQSSTPTKQQLDTLIYKLSKLSYGRPNTYMRNKTVTSSKNKSN